MAFEVSSGAVTYSVDTGSFTIELSYEGKPNGAEPHEGMEFGVNVHIFVLSCIGRFSLQLPALTSIVRRVNYDAAGIGIIDLSPSPVRLSGRVPLCEGSFSGVTDITFRVVSIAPVVDSFRVLFDEFQGKLYELDRQCRVRADIANLPLAGRVTFLRNFLGPLSEISTKGITDANDDLLVTIPNPSGWILSKPTLSPDGLRIAYIALTDSMWGRSKLYVANRDGTDNVLVVDVADSGGGWPSWSPDGSYILLTLQTAAQSTSTLCTVSPTVRNSLQRVLTDPTGSVSQGVVLQRGVWACLRSRRGNTGVDQTILVGTLGNPWQVQAEYQILGLIILTLRAHHRHGAFVITARIDPTQLEAAALLTSETNVLADHAFLVDVGWGVSDLGRGADPAFAGNGCNVIYAKRLDDSTGVGIVQMSLFDPRKTLNFVTTTPLDSEPFGSN